jgi:hypothetical protein
MQVAIRGGRCPRSRAAAAGRSGASRSCSVPLQASAAVETSPETASASTTFGCSLTQGPRPTMEDELRLVEDLPGGFTMAGEQPADCHCPLAEFLHGTRCNVPHRPTPAARIAGCSTASACACCAAAMARRASLVPRGGVCVCRHIQTSPGGTACGLLQTRLNSPAVRPPRARSCVRRAWRRPGSSLAAGAAAHAAGTPCGPTPAAARPAGGGGGRSGRHCAAPQHGSHAGAGLPRGGRRLVSLPGV